MIELRETVYKGKVRPWGKTKGSLTKIPIATQLAEELQAWRRQSLVEQRRQKTWHGPMADSPEAFIFAGRNGGFIDATNFRNRVLHKLAERLGLPKLTFQVIRRTMATLARDKGHVKDIQGMMRHSRLATTTEIYMQSLEEGVRSTVNSIYEELNDTGTWGSGAARKARVVATTQQQQSELIDSARERTTTQTEDHCAKPVRGVVLEFATRMRQSREREELLSD